MTQLAIDFARAEGEAAADRCAAKAEAYGWDKDGAANFIRGHLIRHGQMSGEELVDAAVQHGFRCKDTRAYGAIFQTLARKNLIRCVGFGMRTKGNGTAGLRYWQAVI